MISATQIVQNLADYIREELTLEMHLILAMTNGIPSHDLNYPLNLKPSPLSYCYMLVKRCSLVEPLQVLEGCHLFFRLNKLSPLSPSSQEMCFILMITS